MRRRYWSSAKVRSFKLDYERVMEELKSYAERSLAKGAKAVVLIGSLARGDYTAFSDADVLVLVEKSSKRPVDRIEDFIDPSLSLDLEPLVYAVDEFLEMAREKRKVALEAVRYGKLLAGDSGILEKARKILNSG